MYIMNFPMPTIDIYLYCVERAAVVCVCGGGGGGGSIRPCVVRFEVKTQSKQIFEIKYHCDINLTKSIKNSQRKFKVYKNWSNKDIVLCGLG